MASHAYTILPEQSQEDALHLTRTLAVEERPFQRVSQRLLSNSSLLKPTPHHLPSPPPESDANTERNAKDDTTKYQKFREEILLDFAALESSLHRIHLLQTSNSRERARYAAEKAKITATAQAVRDNTVELRSRLAETRRVLELRKGYDALAAQLLGSGRLKSRAETREESGRLEKAVEELEMEGVEVEGLWGGRREAFERVVGEGRGLVNVIKGVKDEPEKEDVMEEGEEGLGTKGERSRMGTPLLGESTPLPGGSTPLPGEMGEQTPGGEGVASPERAANKFLDVEGDGTRASSRVGSPAIEVQGDVEMAEEQTQLEEVEVDAKEVMEMETVDETEQVATPAENMDES